MKRAHVVIVSTIVGLVGLLSFRSTAVNLSLGSLAAATAPPRSTSTTALATTTTSVPRSSGSTPPPTTTQVVTTTTTTAAAPVARSATGDSSNYSYGILSVKVTVSGTTITNISIASIDDGGNPRSQSIDQQSIPLLEQQALSAQSANIQGVSGASYTTAGFEQSLQSALSKLGL
jgi:uncharacterized protein with FMN-binding domain